MTRLKKISDRVDTLYDYYDYNEDYDYDYESDQKVSYLDPFHADQEDQMSISLSDKRRIDEVDSEDDVFSNFMKKIQEN